MSELSINRKHKFFVFMVSRFLLWDSVYIEGGPQISSVWELFAHSRVEFFVLGFDQELTSANVPSGGGGFGDGVGLGDDTGEVVDDCVFLGGVYLLSGGV